MCQNYAVSLLRCDASPHVPRQHLLLSEAANHGEQKVGRGSHPCTAAPPDGAVAKSPLGPEGPLCDGRAIGLVVVSAREVVSAPTEPRRSTDARSRLGLKHECRPGRRRTTG